MQAGAQVVPGLPVELAPVGEDEVFQAGDAGPGELLVVLLDAPLELGEQVVEEERRHHGKVLGEHVRESVDSVVTCGVEPLRLDGESVREVIIVSIVL